jgi:hypothetical protein
MPYFRPGLSWHCQLTRADWWDWSRLPFWEDMASPPGIPKKAGTFNQSHQSARVSWQCQLKPRAKIWHSSFNSRSFEGAFSGIDRVSCSLYVRIFFKFYFKHFSPNLQRAAKAWHE